MLVLLAVAAAMLLLLLVVVTGEVVWQKKGQGRGQGHVDAPHNNTGAHMYECINAMHGTRAATVEQKSTAV